MSKNDPTLNPLRNLDLLSFVSHELKTPLTTLTLSLEELKHWQGQCPLQKEGQCPAEKHHSSNEASSTKEQSPVPGDLPAPHQKEIKLSLTKNGGGGELDVPFYQRYFGFQKRLWRFKPQVAKLAGGD